ncbi:MAG TPA: DUF4157 domain-containing protein [Herpetosiphonaceae bacterium]
MKRQAAQKPAAVAEQKRRASATNTHERQAREAAARLLDGEADVSRLLTVAPAARRVDLRYRASRGETLPTALRDWLEPGFGADLSAVRIHHDTLAAEIAALEGSRAFASGRHLFFGAGEYQPSQAAGQRLIAHEVAHVLQQTARRRSDGRLIVTDTQGSADVQRADPPSITFEKFKTQYRDYTTSNENFDTLLEVDAVLGDFRTALGTATTLSPTTGALAEIRKIEERVMKGTLKPKQAFARTVLLDAFKYLGRFDGAAELLKQDPFLKTHQPLGIFLDWLVSTKKYGPNYFTSLFSRIPEISQRYPYNYLEAIWRYLFRPASVPSGSLKYEQLAKEYESNYLAGLGSTFLYDNERVRGAYQYLGLVNTELKTLLQETEQRYEQMPLSSRRAAASHLILATAQNWAKSEFSVYKELSPRVAEVAQKAVAFWERARVVADEVARAADTLLQAASQPAPTNAPGTAGATPAPPSVQFPQAPPELLTDRVFSKFVTATRTGLQTVLGGPSLTLLDTPAYTAALTALRQILATQRTALSEHLPNLDKQEQIADQAPFDRAVWLGVAQVFIDKLALTLDEYDEAREKQLTALYGALPDVRLRHRWMVAGAGYILGLMVGDATLKDPMLRVLLADDVGHSYLAFTGEWERDPADVERLESDFPEHALLLGYGLRIAQFRRIFFLLRQQALVKLLRDMLSQSENDLSPQSYGIMQRAIRQAQEDVPYPVRYRATRAMLRWHPSDKNAPERSDLFAIIKNHPRRRELEQLASVSPYDWVIAAPNTRPPEAFAWVLPKFEAVRNYMATIPALREYIKKYVGETLTPENVLTLLEDAHSDAELDPDLAAQLRFTLDEATRDISSETTSTITERDQLFLRALIHDRRIIVAEAGRHLRTYGADARAINYSQSSKAFDLIERFRVQLLHAYPERGVDRNLTTALQFQRQIENDANERHRDLHMTALMLSLTDDLRRAFIRPSALGGPYVERRYDLITDVFGPLNLALGVSAETQIADRLRPYLHASENPTTLLAKRPDLLDLREQLLTVIHAIQRESGLRTSADLKQVTEARGRNSGLAVGEDAPSFTIDGITYQVTHVHTAFIFHPAYGRHTAAYQPSILTDLSGVPITRHTPVKLLDVVYNRGETPITITSLLTPQDDSQELLLEQLSHAVAMQLILEGLQATLKVMEFAQEAIIEGIGVIFPPAQAAIIAADFIKFLVNELPTIREELVRTPILVVEAVQEFLSPDRRDEMLTKLWEYLIFTGDLPFAERIQARVMSGQSGKARHGRPRRSGRFARLISFVRRTGARILDAFFRLRHRMQRSFIRVYRMIERRPLLRRFLRAIPGIIQVGSIVRMSDIQSAREVLGDLVDGNGPATIATHMRETLDEFFDGLNGLEVPAEILPMNLVLDLVIERFLMALGWRGKVLNLALETTNLRQILADKLADALKSEGLDPNILWQELLQGELQTMLEQARTDLIAGINKVFNEMFGSLFQVDATNLPSIKVAADSEPADLSAEPEVEPMLDDDLDEDAEDEADDAQRQPPRIVAAGGVPLPTSTRLRYERSFGHDFRHVRLHYDKRADRITRHYHAQALTSGSHIFLSEKLPPSSPRADSVMKHELAHVLQQTGSRPLTIDQKPDPTLGQPRRGLRLDSRREAGATRMAQKATTGRVNDDPVTVEEADELGGLLPIVASDVAQKLLEKLGSNDVTESFQHSIDTLRSIPSAISNDRRGEFNNAVAAAKKIWDGTHAKLLLTTAASNPMHHGPQTFNNPTARRVIAYYFTNSFDMPSQRLRALTFYSFTIHGNKLSLDPAAFKQNLANYIAGATGFDLVIDPNGSTIDFVKVMNLNLAEVHGNNRVYQTMKQETNDRVTHASPSNPKRLPIPGVTRAFNDVEWAKIREQIAGGATDVQIWDADEYRLSDVFIRTMREMLDAVAGGSVDTWLDYTTPTNVSNATFGGLRVGTHGQLTGDPTRDKTLEPASGLGSGSMTQAARAGRQSHHIPQYLLVEYFQNLASSSTKIARDDGAQKLFPPGFVRTGNTASGFRGAGKSIDFDKLDPGTSGDRGRGLPAISLAAKTHQKGQLHINAASTWGNFTDSKPPIELTGTPTQGVRLDRMFYGLLRTKMKPTPPDDPLLILRAAHSASAKHTEAVYEAIRETYMWMFRGMMGALRRTLTKDVTDVEHWEAVSYRTFALNRPETQTAPGILKPEYIPHNTQLAAVVNAIDTKNRSIMSDWFIT